MEDFSVAAAGEEIVRVLKGRENGPLVATIHRDFRALKFFVLRFEFPEFDEGVVAGRDHVLVADDFAVAHGVEVRFKALEEL